LYVDRAAAEEVENPYALGPALVVPADEFLKGDAAGPGGEHDAVRVPDGAKPVPQPRVAPDGPVLDEFADCMFVGGRVGHENGSKKFVDTRSSSTRGDRAASGY